jgi:hypothetical protein
MKRNKINIKSSLSILSPKKGNLNLINQNSCDKRSINQKEDRDLKLYHTITNRTHNSFFKHKKITSSLDNNNNNNLCQCLLINKRFLNSNKSNTNILPSFKDEYTQKNYSRNKFNTLSTSPLHRYTTESTNNPYNTYNINLINTGELTQISNLLSSFKSPKKKKKKKRTFSINNLKYNSLMYHISKRNKLNDYQIQNRYRPVYKEFFGKKDYMKFANKSKKFVRQEELKLLYKDTTLIIGIFEYLNKSFLKIRYQQALRNHKIKSELLKKKKEEKKNFYQSNEKEVYLPLDKFFQIKKITYRSNNEGTFSVDNKNSIREKAKMKSTKEEFANKLKSNIKYKLKEGTKK